MNHADAPPAVVSDDDAMARVIRIDERDRARSARSERRAAQRGGSAAPQPREIARPAGHGEPYEREVGIEVSPDSALEGHLSAPWGADTHGVVVFAAGCDYRSRLDPYTQRLGQVFNDAGIATLLLDLLSSQEATRGGNLLDVELMGSRLVATMRWLRRQPETAGLAIGYFGEGTGAAAALFAAAQLGREVSAVVCHDGRVEVFGRHLQAITAPVLLTVVGPPDADVLGFNRTARSQLRCESELAFVAELGGASNEIDTLDRLSSRTTRWFIKHLAQSASEAAPLRPYADRRAHAARTA